MKYYLCGPIDSAGDKEVNLNVFREAAKYLRGEGYQIVSPIEEIVEDPSKNYLDYIREDLKHLLGCEAIILLPGWPQSKGAKGELTFAMYLNLPVYYYNPYINVLVSMNF